jgi:ribosomal protein L15
MNSAGLNNFKLVESNAYLKKGEDALKQNQYQTALYYQEQAVLSLNTAKVLASGEVHVIANSTPAASEKAQKEIESALNGPMPKGYGDPVKAYFEKLATEGK